MALYEITYRYLILGQYAQRDTALVDADSKEEALKKAPLEIRQWINRNTIPFLSKEVPADRRRSYEEQMNFTVVGCEKLPGY